jgi:hypothetical protein
LVSTEKICSQLHGMLSVLDIIMTHPWGTTLGLVRRAHIPVMIIFRTPAKSKYMKDIGASVSITCEVRPVRMRIQ